MANGGIYITVEGNSSKNGDIMLLSGTVGGGTYWLEWTDIGFTGISWSQYWTDLNFIQGLPDWWSKNYTGNEEYGIESDKYQNTSDSFQMWLSSSNVNNLDAAFNNNNWNSLHKSKFLNDNDEYWQNQFMTHDCIDL